MYKTLMWIALLVVSFQAQSQSYIIPGKIILNSGDTIVGFVHDKQSESNPKTVTFQRERTGISQEFSIADIRGFTTSRGILYERHQIVYDDSKESLNTLSTSREPEKYANEVALLQILVNGELKLSSYLDRTNRKHYFIHERGQAPKELLNRSYIVDISGQQVARMYEPWRQQLFVMAQGCPTLAAKIKNETKYSDSSLSNVFRLLNKCLGFEVLENEKNNDLTKSKTEFGIALHSFVSRIRFETDRDQGTSSFSKPNFGVGGFVEFFARNRPERLSFYNEIKFKNIDQEGVSNFIYTPVINIQSLKMVNCIRFYYPTRKSSLFTSFGITNGYRHAVANYANKSGGSVLYVMTAEETGFENGLIVGFGVKRRFGNMHMSALLNLDREVLVFFSAFPDFRTTNLGLTIQAGF